MAWSTISFNQNGGTGGETRTLYINYSTSSSQYKINYFATAQSTSSSYRITQVNVPTKSGQLFAGYYFNNTALVSSTGSLTNYVGVYMSSLPSGTLTAMWRNYTIVTIGTNGGSGGTDKIYRRLSDGKCFAEYTLKNPVDTITKPKKYGYDFAGAKYNNVVVIDASGSITAAFRSMSLSVLSITATAQWQTKTNSFGEVQDWFGLANANLVPIASESGDNKQRVCVSNATWSGTTQNGGAGKYDTSVNQLSGTWRNPSVTYKIVKDCTVNVQLGKAYSGSGSTISGFMITEAEIATAANQFPTLTVRAVANEGADAINTFSLSCAVVARSKAQNLMNATSGGGKLQTCVLVATCEPVVLAENMMPCASDVVHGKIIVNANFVAPSMENAPTAANGFTSLGEPKQTTEAYYQTWQFAAEKEMA